MELWYGDSDWQCHQYPSASKKPPVLPVTPHEATTKPSHAATSGGEASTAPMPHAHGTGERSQKNSAAEPAQSRLRTMYSATSKVQSETKCVETSECLVLEMPGQDERAPPWNYRVQGYTQNRMLSGAPWQPLSREADFEKELQLKLTHEIVGSIGRHLITRSLYRDNPALTPEHITESEWQLATLVNRLAVHQPQWKTLIADEYVRLRGTFSVEQLQSRSCEPTDPHKEKPLEPTLHRHQQVERLVETAERTGEVTFFSRIVLRAWRRVTEHRRKAEAKNRMGLRDAPPWVPGIPGKTPSHSASPPELPQLASMSPAAQEEMDQIVAMVQRENPAMDKGQEEENEKLFDRVKAEARRLARQKGSSIVAFRDIRQSVEKMDTKYKNKTSASPAEEMPEHIDEVVVALATLKAEALRLSRGGIAPPKVLIVGETGSAKSPPIVAKMFQEAGADVATCDLKNSEFEGIPHYQGEAVNIQDQGWDLVICHPPCTYLSNAGVSWLTDDPVRWQQMKQNASVFRTLFAAQAPFVVAENAKMHSHARTLIGNVRPTQYVHPWQHGHGHTKPTGLFIRNLPPLIPSRVVPGRENALAMLSASPTRAEKRSRTYPGIAAAMAVQWMPTLLRHVQAPASPRNGLTADQMVQKAEVTPVSRVQIAFIRRAGGLQVMTTKNDARLPTELLGKEEHIGTALKRVVDQLQIAGGWEEALSTSYEAFPDGERSFYEVPSGRFEKRNPTLTRVWVIDITDTHDSYQIATALPKGNHKDGMVWRPLETVKTPFQYEPENGALPNRYRRELDAAARAPLDPLHPKTTAASVCHVDRGEATHRQPWLADYQDLPPPPPTPRHVRRLKGTWRAWRADRPEALPEAENDPDNGQRREPSYSWQAIPPEIADLLNSHLGLPFKPMKATPEGIEQGTKTIPSATKPPGSGATREETCAVTTSSGLDLSGLREVNWLARPAEWLEAQGGNACPALTQSSKLLWNSTAKKPADLLGVGASPNNSPAARKPYPEHNRGARIAFIRKEHRRFISHPEAEPQRPQMVNVADQALPELREANDLYQRWLAEHSREGPAATVAVTTRSQAAETVANQEVTLTPSLGAYATAALYVNNFYVAQKAQTRHTSDDMYSVNHVVMPAGKVLADTGAAPSIVTTELLEKLPRDCRLSRDLHAPVGQLNGADGQPLYTMGTVKIDFKLGDTPCQHVFIVVQGKPLILLGNDFLIPRHAEIHLNTDGQGNGHITLTSPTRGGANKRHSFSVSGNSRRLNQLCPVDRAEDPTTSPSTEPTGAAASLEPPTLTERWVPEPTEPTQLTTEAFNGESWRLETSEHLLYTTDAVVIPRRSRITVKVRAPRRLMEQAGIPSCLVDRIREFDDHHAMGMVPPVVTRLATIEDGFVEVQLVNPTDKKIAIPGYSPLAMLDSEYYVRGSLRPECEDPPPTEEGDPLARLTEAEAKLLSTVCVDPEARLSEEQTKRVRRLLAENVSAFAIDPKNPTKTHLMEVELPLKAEAMPHRHGASRVGEEGRQIIEKHIEEMESRGIIRKSNSAWGSRVVLVTKKDGSIRFCVDYRDLNAKLKLQDSPIPLTVEALDRLSSGKGCQTSLFLSTLDLASGFWTLPIREADKGMTAFVTHRQKYEFNYLPFGIQSGPSYMVRLMDAALQGLAWETCMPYLDDVGIWSTGSGEDPAERESNSFEQMMTRLRAVFERLRWAGLSMKASKCVLFATKAEYLGHIVSREGLRMDPKKISAVKDMDPTNINTVTKIRSFLGMCSYYRRFIEGFSRIATPLTDLTKDGVDVERESQTPACRRAMQILIKAITSEPVMSTPRFDRPFIVKTDAANKEGLGGVLSQQDDDGRERVVAYHGRRLNKHERNYTVTEIELLAAVDSIKHWRPYLWGRSFKLVVDHSALRWLHTMRDTMEGGPASRLMRWILKLSEYRFYVEHKPGALHKDADGLSRLVTGTEQKPTLPESLDAMAVTSRNLPRPNPSSARTTTARSKQRAERPATTKEDINISYLQTGAPSEEQIKREQEEDSECVEIMDYLSGDLDDIADYSDLRRLAKLARTTTSATHNQKRAACTSQDETKEGAKVIRRIAVKNGILYRVTRVGETNDPESDQWVPYVPAKLRLPLITAFHDRMGHASRDRVRIALQQRFYWPNLGREVSDYVSECHECTMAKPPPTRGRNPVGPTVGRYPFDLLYTDILDMADTHDYTKEGAGFRKLVVFADSLSRWVEAVPVHKDPTSAEILDIFNEHIVARYGVPRAIVSDRGSNLVGKLNAEILRCTGTDLRGTTAEHKEANGVVERFNQTLQNMIRAADEGGRRWKDHLPFVLMAYRGTQHRATKETPAMILYGRELRLPAQLGTKDPPPSTLMHSPHSKEIREYATRLHNRVVYAWRAAYDATREAQGETVSLTAAKSHRGPKTYEVNDRVVRRLYDAANSLENKYAGPYRITEILGRGRYRVQDLENKLVYDEFDVSNLRPYKTHTDEEELTPDEYVVESLLSRKTAGEQDSYLVKYLGYPKSEAQWTLRTELERRCEELLAAYDLAHPKSKKAKVPTPPPVIPKPASAGTKGTPSAQETAEDTSSHLPEVARLNQGEWSYGRRVKSRHAKNIKYVWKDGNHFTAAELDSEKFRLLRTQAAKAAETDSDLASVFYQILPEYPGISPTPDQYHFSAPTAMREEGPMKQAVRVWFVTNEEAICYHRSRDDPDRPPLETYGGDMIPADGDSYADCAMRILQDLVNIPPAWLAHARRATTLDPEGQETVRSDLDGRGTRTKVALWFVRLTENEAAETPTLTTVGEGEVAPRSMRWRAHGEVLSNLSTFDKTHAPLVKAMKKWILPLSSR